MTTQAASGDPGCPLVLESRTRDRVLQAISERGPITAATLADDLGLTAPAVRRHLENLEEAGLITEREAAPGVRGRGRPARSFVLSDAGHQALESDYDHLATEALRFLAQEAGEEAVRRFAESRVAELEGRYAARAGCRGHRHRRARRRPGRRPDAGRLRRLGPPGG